MIPSVSSVVSNGVAVYQRGVVIDSQRVKSDNLVEGSISKGSGD